MLRVSAETISGVPQHFASASSDGIIKVWDARMMMQPNGSGQSMSTVDTRARITCMCVAMTSKVKPQAAKQPVLKAGSAVGVANGIEPSHSKTQQQHQQQEHKQQQHKKQQQQQHKKQQQQHKKQQEPEQAQQQQQQQQPPSTKQRKAGTHKQQQQQQQQPQRQSQGLQDTNSIGKKERAVDGNLVPKVQGKVIDKRKQLKAKKRKLV
eukprot:jgi/Chrzof1/135/Cz01g04180.t1